MKLRFIFLILAIMSLQNTRALVEYDDNASEGVTIPASGRSVVKGQGIPRPVASKNINFGMIYQANSLNHENYPSSVNTLSLNMDLKPSTYLSIAASYPWYDAKASKNNQQAQENFEGGNPSAELTLNWLSLGQRGEELRLDFVVGGNFQTSQSVYAADHSDWMVGLHTTKTFGESFVMGMGGEHQFVGKSSRPKAALLALESKSTFLAALGYLATPDIRMQLQTTLGRMSGVEKLSFGVLSSSLHLLLSEHYNLEMGAHFPTKKVNESWREALIESGGLTQSGLLGNSLFAGINFLL